MSTFISTIVLAIISCIYSIALSFAIWHALKQYKSVQKEIKFKLSNGRIVIGVIPLLLYLLNQSLIISLIVFYFEIGQISFFIILFVSFIVYKFLMSIIVSHPSNALDWIATFFTDYKLFRSLLLFYVCSFSDYQNISFKIQCILSFTHSAFSIILLLTLPTNQSFMLWYSLFLSLVTFIYYAMHFSAAPILCFFDIIAQIIIFSLTYLFRSHVVFYAIICIILVKNFVLICTQNFGCLLSIFYERNDYYDKYAHKHGCELGCVTGTTLFFTYALNFILCVQNTASVSNASLNTAHQKSVFLALIIFCWIFGVAMHLVCFLAYLKMEHKEDKKYNYPLNYLKSKIQKLYFGDTNNKSIEKMLVQTQIDDELKEGERESEFTVKLLLIGDENDASCKVLRQINNHCHGADSKGEPFEEINAMLLVFGYVHRFEISQNQYVPNEVTQSIVQYFGKSDLLSCCYDNKIVDYYFGSRPFHFAHIHQISDIFKLSHCFDFRDVVIYCVSLATYCKSDDEGRNLMRKSVETFEKIRNDVFLPSGRYGRTPIILLFTDYKEFELQIANGRLIWNYLPEELLRESKLEINGTEPIALIKEMFTSRIGSRDYVKVFCVEHDAGWNKALDQIQEIAATSALRIAWDDLL